MRSVVVQPEAIQETDDAFEWYEDQEAGLGFRFLHDLEITYAAIARTPKNFQPLRDGFRRAILRRFPYAIFLSSMLNWSWFIPFFIVHEIPMFGIAE